MFFIKNRDKLLSVAAVITFLIAGINALEYFFAGKRYLSINKGIVKKVSREYEDGKNGELYSKTAIYLTSTNRKFYLRDKTNRGAYIDVSEGDTITIYAKKRIQFLYNYEKRTNIYCVERGGEVIFDNLSIWKASAFTYMLIYGGCSLLLLIMYLDQVKNISISNWFKKRFLSKQQ
ncbi:MAG: hypothetical protein HZB42_04750 [Sphingobacteriales bacterium]|nr:hypothetical protein [Sphingobacteriales bacterium]